MAATTIHHRIESGGAGFVLQAAGIIAMIGLIPFFPLGAFIGIAVGFGLIAWGRHLTHVYTCGSCGGRLRSAHVKDCPHCNAAVAQA